MFLNSKQYFFVSVFLYALGTTHILISSEYSRHNFWHGAEIELKDMTFDRSKQLRHTVTVASVADQIKKLLDINSNVDVCSEREQIYYAQEIDSNH